MKRKPVVGEILFSLNVGNSSRHTPQVLKPVKVCKIGRKYFSTHSPDCDWLKTQFRLSDWTEHTEYSGNSRLYETEQEWEDEKEARKLNEKIHLKFRYATSNSNLSIETLRKIVQLIQ